MKTINADPILREIDLPVVDRAFIDESFERVSGAPLIQGNDLELLIDATENYPAWLESIRAAKRRVLFESYIIHGDEQGEMFADALIERARAGVEVKLIYDWLGGVGVTPRSYWRRLREGGVEVRCYNPPRLRDPLGVFCRDHRKTMVVDGKVAFVSGLCVGQDWVGYPELGMPPWRDTGVKLIGPAVTHVEEAFADVWDTMGEPLPLDDVDGKEFGEAGTTPVRVVKSEPGTSYIYRLDQLMSAAAQETMWLSDAYFVGVPSYIQNLKNAAADGVDVRLLVPQSTDIGIIRDTTRSTYRPLLEAGVRVFEWNGTMMHAKTAVFDGRFSRVGSTNLNIASWFGNYELDVFVECNEFAKKMQEMFLRDLENSTEIILSDAHKAKIRPRRLPRLGRKGSGSLRKTTAGALNAASSIGSALANKAVLGPAESRLLLIAGSILMAGALFLLFFPRAASVPIIAILLLLAIPTLIKAVQGYREN